MPPSRAEAFARSMSASRYRWTPRMLPAPVRSDATARTPPAGPVTTIWKASCSLRAAEMDALAAARAVADGRIFSSDVAVHTWAASAHAGQSTASAAARPRIGIRRRRLRRGRGSERMRGVLLVGRGAPPPAAFPLCVPGASVGSVPYLMDRAGRTTAGRASDRSEIGPKWRGRWEGVRRHPTARQPDRRPQRREVARLAGRATACARAPSAGFFSSSSMVRGQSSLRRRARERSERICPPVWQRGQ